MMAKVKNETKSKVKFPALEIQTGKCGGKGVFATQAIGAGRDILVFVGPVLRELELDDPEHSIQIGDDLFLGPSGEIDDFVNHSCNPNCGLRVVEEELTLVSIRKIAVGEELTFDYATSVGPGDDWTMQCACAAEHCRGTIAKYSLLPAKIKQRYLRAGVVPPFVLESVHRKS